MRETAQKILVGIIAQRIDEKIGEIKKDLVLKVLEIEPKTFYKEILQATKEACELLERSISILETDKK